MSDFEEIQARALSRKGGSEGLDRLLPRIASHDELQAMPDDRFLAVITQCVFRAGFVWQVIEHKWPGFEAAFKGFVPRYWQQVAPEVLDALMQDERIVRNRQKIETVPANARMIVEASSQHDGFGRFLAQWPSSDQVGLLHWLKQNGSRMGGTTPQYFLRSIGWDGFVLSGDVVRALRLAGRLSASPSSQKGLQQVQQAFNEWHQETGRPYAHLSRILACSVDD